MVGAVEIVEPFGEVYVGVLSAFVSLPSAFPRLVGLVFPRYKSPIIATYLFQIEQGEQGENVVSEASSQPLGIHYGATLFFQTLDDFDMHVIISVTVIGNDIRVIKCVLLHLVQRFTWVAAYVEDGAGQGLRRLAGADNFEYSFQIGQSNILSAAVSRLVVDVPNADSFVVLVLGNDLLHHSEIVLTADGIVKIEVGGRLAVGTVLGVLFAAERR